MNNYYINICTLYSPKTVPTRIKIGVKKLKVITVGGQKALSFNLTEFATPQQPYSDRATARHIDAVHLPYSFFDQEHFPLY